MSSNDNEPAVFTVTDLCKRWKCDRHTVLDLIHANKLTAFKLGKRAYRITFVAICQYELVRDKAA